MKKIPRVILRTETFERISLRQTSKTMECRAFILGIYKIEISQAKSDVEQIVFETKFSGFIEIKDNDDEIQINIQKI